MKGSDRKLRDSIFLPALLLVAVFLYTLDTPAYTRWVSILLILPSIYFLVQSSGRLNLKKVGITAGGAIGTGLLWDHIAIGLHIWDFPKESVSGWFLGIPLEEYFFGVCFVIIVLGIYTSLPVFRKKIWNWLGKYIKSL